MTSYFEDFKKTMKGKMRIPISLVEKHVHDICFLVDIEFNYIQNTLPRVRWLRPLGYEINVDEASVAITALLAEDFDKEAKHFGTYDIIKSWVDIDLKIASSIRKTKGAQCKFGAILVSIFFYVQNEFPSFGKHNWKTNRSVIE